jgi:hypothetical protein
MPASKAHKKKHTDASLLNPGPLPPRPSFARSFTDPFEQLDSDCIKKAHSRLLSNYFCYLLQENNPVVINQVTFAFDAALNNYTYQETKKKIIKGYGGHLKDVLGRIIDGIKKSNLNATIYTGVFNIAQQGSLRDALNIIGKSDIDSEDNATDEVDVSHKPVFHNPGNIAFSVIAHEFCNEAIRYAATPTFFLNYFCVSILLVPSFYYWFSQLDNTNIYSMPPDLKTCVENEISRVRWDGPDSIDGKYKPNGIKTSSPVLNRYTINNNLPKPLKQCFGWEGHEFVIKGYDPNYLGFGIACYFIQNSWGANWNKTCSIVDAPGRWVEAAAINMVLYGVIKIIFPPTTYWAQGITKRKKKPNKSKKQKQSRRRRIKTRRL